MKIALRVAVLTFVLAVSAANAAAAVISGPAPGMPPVIPFPQ